MRQCSSRSLPPGESDQGRESATFGAHSRQLFAPSAFCTSSARTLRSTAPSVRMPPQLQTRLRKRTPFISNALPRVTSRRASPAGLWRRTSAWPRGRAWSSSLHSATTSVSLRRSAFVSSARNSSVVSLSICSLLHFATRPRGRIRAARISFMARPRLSGQKQKGPDARALFSSPARYTSLMLAARGPLGLCSTSYCTLSLSFSVLNPLAWMDEKCTKRSLLPSSGVMKPKPLASLNHFTVPVLMSVSLISIGKKGAIGRKPALRKIKERTNRRGQYEPLRPDQPTRCLRILLYRYTGIRARSPIKQDYSAGMPASRQAEPVSALDRRRRQPSGEHGNGIRSADSQRKRSLGQRHPCQRHKDLSRADRLWHTDRARSSEGRRPAAGAALLLRRSGIRADAAVRSANGAHLGRRLSPSHRLEHARKRGR